MKPNKARAQIPVQKYRNRSESEAAKPEPFFSCYQTPFSCIHQPSSVTFQTCFPICRKEGEDAQDRHNLTLRNHPSVFSNHRFDSEGVGWVSEASLLLTTRWFWCRLWEVRDQIKVPQILLSRRLISWAVFLDSTLRKSVQCIYITIWQSLLLTPGTRFYCSCQNSGVTTLDKCGSIPAH